MPVIVVEPNFPKPAKSNVSGGLLLQRWIDDVLIPPRNKAALTAERPDMKIMTTVACAAAMLLVGCTQPEGARQALEAQGYTNVQMGGYDWLSCSKSDPYHDKFAAKGPTGKQVTGVVCAGLFSGSVVRLD